MTYVRVAVFQASLVLAPEGSVVGERVFLQSASDEERKLRADVSVDFKDKKNPWLSVAPTLRTNARGQVAFDGVPLVTAAGAVTSALADCRVK